jgi:hypothetical protein
MILVEIDMADHLSHRLDTERKYCEFKSTRDIRQKQTFVPPGCALPRCDICPLLRGQWGKQVMHGG